MTLNISISNHKVFFTIYPVEGEWEYYFAHFQKGVKNSKGSQDQVWVPMGVNPMISWRIVEDGAGFEKLEAGPLYKSTSCARLHTTKLSMA